jgi:integrase
MYGVLDGANPERTGEEFTDGSLGTAEDLKSIASARNMVVGIRREVNVKDIRLRKIGYSRVLCIKAAALTWHNRSCGTISFLLRKLGINKRIGWHTFRHTYSTLLRSTGPCESVPYDSLMQFSVALGGATETMCRGAAPPTQ